MGHNIGMRHTWEGKHEKDGCQTKVHGISVIMRSDITGRPWSPCSKADFQARYLQVKDNWCMEGKVYLSYDTVIPRLPGL